MTQIFALLGDKSKKNFKAARLEQDCLYFVILHLFSICFDEIELNQSSLLLQIKVCNQAKISSCKNFKF